MAIDDTSFYNVMGEEISRSYLLQQMIDFYQLKKEVGETEVTDFNEGSEIRNLLEAVAVDNYILMEEENELTRMGFIDTAEGEYLDKHGLNPFINLPRDFGQEASGFVTFTIPSAVTDEITIAEGTILVNDDGLEFATDNEGLIVVGETNCEVACSCLTTGTDGNTGANTITIIDDDYINIDGLSVNNSEAFTGGTDYEEDDEYRERLLAYVRQDDFGSIRYYINLCESIENVHDVLLVDDENYTKKVIVNAYEKPTSDAILLEVLYALTDSQNIVIGHNFIVDKPAYVSLNLTLNLQVTETIDTEMIQDILQTFFDGGSSNYIMVDFEGLNIGEGVNKQKIIDVLSLIDDIVSVTVIDTSTGEELQDISIESDEVLKLGNLIINQTIVE